MYFFHRKKIRSKKINETLNKGGELFVWIAGFSSNKFNRVSHGTDNKIEQPGLVGGVTAHGCGVWNEIIFNL